jgi:hypothetical protein
MVPAPLCGGYAGESRRRDRTVRRAVASKSHVVRNGRLNRELIHAIHRMASAHRKKPLGTSNCAHPRTWFRAIYAAVKVAATASLEALGFNGGARSRPLQQPSPSAPPSRQMTPSRPARGPWRAYARRLSKRRTPRRPLEAGNLGAAASELRSYDDCKGTAHHSPKV